MVSKSFEYLKYLFNSPRIGDIWVCGINLPEDAFPHNFSVIAQNGDALGIAIGIALSTPKNVLCLIPNTDLKRGKTLEALEIMDDLRIPNIHLVIDNVDDRLVWQYKFLSKAYLVNKFKLYDGWVPAPDPQEAGSRVIWVLGNYNN